jgi:hypothetical protein
MFVGCVILNGSAKEPCQNHDVWQVWDRLEICTTGDECNQNSLIFILIPSTTTGVIYGLGSVYGHILPVDTCERLWVDFKMINQ